MRAENLRFNFDLGVEEIESVKKVLGVSEVKDIQSGEVSGTLDEVQVKLTTFKLEKQIIIEGPAGSGKSIVLLNRALNIKKKYPSWQVGILCYNAVMANYLRTILNRTEYGHNEVEIYDVWDWIRKYLPEAHEKARKSKDFDKSIIEALENSNYSVGRQYDALLVDEGQDSTEAHLTLYRAMLNRSSNSFTFCYDIRQSIYGKGELIEKMADFGFEIDNERSLIRQKRSVFFELAMNYYEAYKNPETIISEIVLKNKKLREKYFFRWYDWLVAKATGAIKFFSGKKKSDSQSLDFEEVLSQSVDFIQSKSIGDMVARLADNIAIAKNKHNVGYANWLVIFPAYVINDEKVDQIIQNVFQEKGIPFIYVHKERGATFKNNEDEAIRKEEGDNRRNAELNYDGVKIMTIHSAKGFDCKRVAILAFDKLDQNPDNKLPAELGYVAITRAKEYCAVYYIDRPESVKILLGVFSEMTKGASRQPVFEHHQWY